MPLLYTPTVLPPPGPTAGGTHPHLKHETLSGVTMGLMQSPGSRITPTMQSTTVQHAKNNLKAQMYKTASG